MALLYGSATAQIRSLQGSPRLGGEEVRGPSSEAVSAGVADTAADSAAVSAGAADSAAVETLMDLSARKVLMPGHFC